MFEFVYEFSASDKDYKDVFNHYRTRELTDAEKENMYGKFVIIFESIEELMRFQNEVCEIVIGTRTKNDNSGEYKVIIIYDDFIY